MSTVQLLLVLAVVSLTQADPSCPCKKIEYCRHPEKDPGISSEVLVFSNGATNVQTWSWSTITAVIVPSNFSTTDHNQTETMCVTHKNNRKFGITVEMGLKGQINDSSRDAYEWIEQVRLKQQQWFAELVVVNLLPYFKTDTDSFRQDHIGLVKILYNARNITITQSPVVKFACIIPWVPPCADDDTSCDFTSLSRDVCDYFIINPDSFTDLDDVKCRARATIPLPKIIYGISEYNSHGVSNSQIILGVAWHGYDYTCQKLENDKICHLDQTNSNSSSQSKCDFSQRRRLAHAQLVAEHPEGYQNPNLDPVYGAPYLNYKLQNTGDKLVHQVWFEDRRSLYLKYRLVHEMQLKGVAVLYADDLSLDKTPNHFMNDKDMWDWVSHEFVLSVSHKTLPEMLYYADTIAVVAVTCIIIGAALGVIFTCVGLRCRIRKPQPPFTRDLDGNMDEYTDEDPNL